MVPHDAPSTGGQLVLMSWPASRLFGEGSTVGLCPTACRHQLSSSSASVFRLSPAPNAASLDWHVPDDPPRWASSLPRSSSRFGIQLTNSPAPGDRLHRVIAAPRSRPRRSSLEDSLRHRRMFLRFSNGNCGHRHPAAPAQLHQQPGCRHRLSRSPSSNPLTPVNLCSTKPASRK